jgi:hypothetical protein
MAVWPSACCSGERAAALACQRVCLPLALDGSIMAEQMV